MSAMRILSAIAALAGLSALLAACFTVPGDFEAEMVVKRDGTYSYTYDGELQLVSLGYLMMQAGSSDYDSEFTPYCPYFSSPQYDEDDAKKMVKTNRPMTADEAADAAEAAADAAADSVDDAAKPVARIKAPVIRTVPVPSADAYGAEPDDYDYSDPANCTSESLAEQKEQWEERRAEKEQEREEMKQVLGGIDVADPASIERFAKRIEAIEGWEKVEYKGGILFDVRFSVKGTIPSSLSFPTIPDYPVGMPILTLVKRDDGKVAVSAPGFVNSESWPSYAGARAMGAGKPDKMSPFDGKRTQGTFTIRTDGQILTNNTHDGPESTGGMNVLTWHVGDPGQAQPPMALIGL